MPKSVSYLVEFFLSHAVATGAVCVVSGGSLKPLVAVDKNAYKDLNNILSMFFIITKVFLFTRWIPIHYRPLCLNIYATVRIQSHWVGLSTSLQGSYLEKH